MSDIVQSLRLWVDRDGETTPLGREAAAEIERLRMDASIKCNCLEAEVERLRAENASLLQSLKAYNAIIEERAQVATLEYSSQAMPTSVIDNVCRGIAAAIRGLTKT